jgi:hypothetical protein
MKPLKASHPHSVGRMAVKLSARLAYIKAGGKIIYDKPGCIHLVQPGLFSEEKGSQVYSSLCPWAMILMGVPMKP